MVPNAEEIGRSVRRVRRRELGAGLLFVLPAILFLAAVFVAPLALFIWRSVDNESAFAALPDTRTALAGWDGEGLPPEAAFAALVADVKRLDRPGAAVLGRRLNYSDAGFRSRVLALYGLAVDAGKPLARQLVAADPAWGKTRTWDILQAESGRFTAYYLLRALDLERIGGSLRPVAGEDATFRVVFARTFWISGVVSLLCLLLGFPVAYVLATASGVWGKILLLLVLLPFWTSVLVRTTSWILLLQQNGILNRFLINYGIIGEPLALIYNRTGVYIAMTHVLLPLFVLPLYGVMLKVDRAQLRAAASLGAPPLSVFRHAYLPQVMSGVIAGLVLVFVTAIGFYITPVLVGGGGDQMISSFVAFYTNASVNWGMAASLGTLLLVATLVVLGAFRRFVPGARTVPR